MNNFTIETEWDSDIVRKLHGYFFNNMDSNSIDYVSDTVNINDDWVYPGLSDALKELYGIKATVFRELGAVVCKFKAESENDYIKMTMIINWE